MAEAKSQEVREVAGFGTERSFTRGMPKKPNYLRLRGGPEVGKRKQQVWVAHFRRFSVKV